jgi:hypothetical protein
MLAAVKLTSSGSRSERERGDSYDQTTTTSVKARICHAVLLYLFARKDPVK